LEVPERRELLDGIQKVVVKIGTSSITKDECIVDTGFMDRVAEQVRTLHDLGLKVILVSSGAIGLGLHAMGICPKPKEVPIRQAAASVGQGILMQEWKNSFDRVGLKIAQILLTYDFYSDRVRYLNLRNNISTLLDHGIVPIINENDAVATNEIEAVFGDNDTLSAMVASKIESDLLVILSDVDGLYDRNPKNHSDAQLIPIVRRITPKIESFGGDPSSTKGVGGMKTKVQAAKICYMSGCHMVIAHHLIDNVITKVVSGDQIGTLFLAKGTVDRNKTRWILLAHSSGKVFVDQGCMLALQRRKNGLLPAGVVGVEGRFERGDVVDLVFGDELFAKGITDYTSEELAKVMGAHSDEIEELLGYQNYANVVKKENLGFVDDPIHDIQ
jgi:glutamate 5-kinase